MFREFVGDVMRRVRIVREQFDYGDAIAHSAFVDFVAENIFRAANVHGIIEIKFGFAFGLANGPSGETFCDFDHVLLGVAAIDAKRVQLH